MGRATEATAAPPTIPRRAGVGPGGTGGAPTYRPSPESLDFMRNKATWPPYDRCGLRAWISHAGERMTRSPFRSPYLWAIVGLVTVVTVAWIGRENYQPVITGSDAPDFTARTESGEVVALSDYRGKVVLVNVWATWCPPCIEEMPSLQRLYEALDDPDFEILAVSVDSRAGELNRTGREGGDVWGYGEQLGLTFPLVHDADARIQQLYQTTGVPETFIVGRNGVIYKKVAGPTDWDAPVNQELVRRLLDE